MSTRSQIGLQTEGGVVSIYCHFDGYPEGVGSMLNKHYKDVNKIKELIALGNLSVLGEEIGSKQDFNNRPENNWCLAYGRDRGETGEEAKVSSSTAGAQIYAKNSGCEYAYFYQPDPGWTCYDLNTGSVINLKEIA